MIFIILIEILIQEICSLIILIMHLIFSPKASVNEIKQQFRALFPFLKIEFFDTSHKNNEGSSSKHIVDGNKLLGSLNSSIPNEQLQLNPLMLVSELESSVKALFGLNVQVFRRANSVWLETTQTDNWTLAKQNIAGQESLSPLAEDKIAYEDLDRD